MRMSNRQKNALEQGSQMEPRYSSGRRMIVLGFLENQACTPQSGTAPWVFDCRVQMYNLCPKALPF